MNNDKNTVGAQSGNDMINGAHTAASKDTRFGGADAPESWRGGRQKQRFTHKCPHCDSLATMRTTRAVTPLFRELRFQCTNVEGDDACGHTFVASLVIERTIVPSARPNPRIKLPIAPPRKNRTALPAPAV